MFVLYLDFVYLNLVYMKHYHPEVGHSIDQSPSVFIALPIIQTKKLKKKCCKKFKKGNRCKKCPGQRVDK